MQHLLCEPVAGGERNVCGMGVIPSVLIRSS